MLQVGIRRTTWEDVQAQPIVVHQQSDEEQCCNEDEIDWAYGMKCAMQSFMRINYTAVAFLSLHQQ